MKQVLFILLFCLPIFAMGQTDDTTTPKKNEHIPSTRSLEKGSIWQITNDLDKKIATALVYDKPYQQFTLQFDTHKAYNLSFGTQTTTKEQSTHSGLTPLKPIHYYYGQFKVSE